MAYNKQTWQDDNAAFPLSAARLNVIENGIQAAAATADSAVTAAGQKVPKWQANTVYVTGDIVMSPSGAIVKSNTGQSSSVYSDTNWDLVTATVNYVDAADSDLDTRMLDLQSQVSALVSSPGTTGAENVYWGDADETTVVTTGATYRPYMALGPTDLLLPVGAQLLGGSGSGDVVVDIEMSTNGFAGPWTSVFGATAKPTIGAGTRRGFSGGTMNSVLVSMTQGALLRAVVLSAPAGAGGSTTWRTPLSAGNGATAAVTELTIPKPTGLAAGDLQVAVLFLPVTATTPTWGAGWSALGAPFPVGEPSPNGPFYAYVATKTATASEPTATVSFTSTAAVMSTIAVSNATLITPTSANFAVNVTAAATAATPSGLTTPAANCVVVHLAMPRWTSGNVPSTITWDGSLATDTQAQTARGTPVGTGASNTGIAVSHLTQAAAGAVAVRTASFTAQARNITGTLVFQPSSGTTTKGIQINARVRAA